MLAVFAAMTVVVSIPLAAQPPADTQPPPGMQSLSAPVESTPSPVPPNGLRSDEPPAAAATEATTGSSLQEPLASGQTLAGLQAQLQAFEASAELDPAVKAEVVAQYKKAVGWLQSIESLRKQTADWMTQIANAPAELQQAQQRLAEPPVPPKPAYSPDTPLSDLVKSLADAQKQLDEARAELARREADLKLRERKTELVKLTEEITRQQAALTQGPLAVPEGEHPAITTARRAELDAHLAYVATQLENYRVEARRLEELDGLFQLRRDIANRQVTRLEQLVAAWQKVVDEARQQESVRQAAEARRALANAHPSLKSLAERNLALTEEGKQLAANLGKVAGEVQDNQKKLTEIVDQRSTVTEKVRVAGLTTTIGLLLRQQRETLPDEAELKQQLRFVQSEMPASSLRIIELKDDRTGLGDPDRMVEQILQRLEHDKVSVDRGVVEPMIRESLENQRQYVNALLDDYQIYVDDLGSLEASTRLVLNHVDEFEEYIDERILWIRSSNRIGKAEFITAGKDLLVLGDPVLWLDSLKAIAEGMFDQNVLVITILICWVILLLFGRSLRQMLYQLARPAQASPFQNVTSTLQACAVTFAIAISWPLLFWILGWRLSMIEPGTGLIAAVAEGLSATASVFLPLEFVRQVFRPRGLADGHLGWDPGSAQVVRIEVRRLMLVGLPLTFAVNLVNAYGDGVWQESLGRLVFIAGLLLLAYLLHRMFHPVNGPLSRIYSADPQSLPWRMRKIIYVAAVGAPSSLALLSIFGFGYTASQLTGRLLVTVWYILAVILIRNLVARWFFLRQWKLARQRAEQQRVVEESIVASGEGVAAPGEPTSLLSELTETAREAIREQEEQRLVVIDIQLQQLLRMGVLFALLIGGWMIWAGVFPALNRLDRITVWPGAVPLTEPQTPADSGPVEPSEPQPTSLVPTAPLLNLAAEPGVDDPTAGTSLADILFAILIAIATVLAGRNVPGLLEVTLLERLPMDQGARDALTKIFGYAIMLGGLIVGCKTIGLSWQNVQWLAAAVTVGLGFGLQEIFANFVSGLILLFERPIRVGDVITLGETTGTVTNIRIRATTITNWDRQELVVPNKDLVTGRLLNWTLTDRINRLVINVGVAYGSDTRQVRKLIARIADQHSCILADPPPVVTFEGFGDSTLNFVLRCHLSNLADRLPTIHDLHEAIHERFAAAGIEIAFPQRDLRLRTPVELTRRTLPDAKDDSST